VYGDCNLIAHPVGVWPVRSGRTLHREKLVLQDEMQSAEWATALCAVTGRLSRGGPFGPGTTRSGPSARSGNASDVPFRTFTADRVAGPKRRGVTFRPSWAAPLSLHAHVAVCRNAPSRCAKGCVSCPKPD